MTDSEGYLRAILEHPEDDNLRLQYADVLNDDGQSDLAEFIRLHVAIARNPDFFVTRDFSKQARRTITAKMSRLERGGNRDEMHAKMWSEAYRMRDLAEARIKEDRQRINDLWKPPLNRDWIKSLGIGTLVLDNPNVGVSHSGCNSIGIVRRGFIAEFRGTWAEWQRLAPKLVWWGPRKCPLKLDADFEAVNADRIAEMHEAFGCKVCRGTGEILGATVVCPTCERGDCIACKGSGRRYGRRYPTVVSGNCRACDGSGECGTCNGAASGRIPAPFPADTVQPIEVVTLTTPPIRSIHAAGGFGERRELSGDEAVAFCRSRWPTVREWRFEGHYERTNDEMARWALATRRAAELPR